MKPIESKCFCNLIGSKMKSIGNLFSIGIALAMCSIASADTEIRMVDSQSLSPDGSQMLFSWMGDIWTVPSDGGVATRLTSDSANDTNPRFSPDGKQIGFNSSRDGNTHVYVMPAEGGLPKRLTYHSEGSSLVQWSNEGRSMVINASRDHFWRDGSRYFEIEVKERPFEKLLFDAYGSEGQLSSDGNRMLYTREGVQWWRKGYHGSQAGQIWMYDRQKNEHTKVCEHESGCRWPMWAADENEFYYVSQKSGSFNLWKKNLQSGEDRQLTSFTDDSVVYPCVSADGKTIVFHHLFDLYKFQPGGDAKPKKIAISYKGDRINDPIVREVVSSATDVSFSDDGLEMAFVANGDIWVMDTELKEPKQITFTGEFERELMFSPDGKQILFIGDHEGQSDIWSATREDESKYWWQNDKFKLNRLTEDSDFESNLAFSPTGEYVAFSKIRGDLWIMKPDGTDSKRVFESWSEPDYSWSPDGKWLVYSWSDNDFNQDVFIVPVDMSREPFNLSMHPDNDGNPVWSPDGKMIAFTGQQVGTETDIYYVYLQKKEEETTNRDKSLEKAIEKMKKGRSGKSTDPRRGGQRSDPGKDPGKDPGTEPGKAAEPGNKSEPGNNQSKSDDEEKPEEGKAAKEGDNEKDKKVPEVKIDFDDIVERIHRVSIPNANEGGLFWSPDSKKLAFSSSIDGERGLFTIEPGESTQPKLLTSTNIRVNRWLEKGNQIVGLAGGTPTALTVSQSGSVRPNGYSFSLRHQYDQREKFEAAFDLCWREMRDTFYDGNLNNKNWDAIRRKYRDHAREAVDSRTFGEVVNMMLGELNGSHMGFFAGMRTGRRGNRGGDGPPSTTWQDTTAHFGLRFDREFAGPGLKVIDVIYDSPAWQQRSRIEIGEIIISIDGTDVDPQMELTEILNGPLDRDMILKVKNEKGELREVAIRPTSYGRVRSLLYDHWIRNNREAVDKASDGKFGYIHIQAMSMPSFYRFERELYSVGNGKDGLIIDVRENGGGSTADHVLTVLTQPVHAITVPRGGGPGYPQDRKVYASWYKPVVVLCNQNSFSNAEIISHAIKTLERGKLVGVPTAGGVISTGGTSILDIGFIRKPFRAWYVSKDGEDMELNGAVPHHIVWPVPGDMPKGKDDQLSKAIAVLAEDVKEYQARPQPTLKPASQRKSTSK
jgi:tricorn protease